MDSSATFSPGTPMLLLGAQSVALYVDHGECNYLLANPDLVAALSVELCVRRMPHGSGVANVSAASAAERPASTLSASNATLRASFFCTPLNHSLIDLDNQFASDVYWSWVQVAPPPSRPPALSSDDLLPESRQVQRVEPGVAAASTRSRCHV